jgi:hypothetical protein
MWVLSCPSCSSDPKDYTSAIGCSLFQIGAARSVLDCQCARGFAFVLEGVLQRLLEVAGDAVPVHHEAVGDFKFELSLQVMQKLKPEMTFEQVAMATNLCFSLENPDADKQLSVGAELIGELCRPADAKDIKGYASDVSKAKVRKAAFLKTRNTRISNFFAGCPVGTKKLQKPPRFPMKPSAMADEVEVWLNAYLPPGNLVKVALDQYNGRFRVINYDLQWKSISYTQRGFLAATSMVLHQAWSYYTEWTGLPPLFDLAQLVPDFLVDEA